MIDKANESLGILDSAEVFTMNREEALEKFNLYREAMRRSRSAADKLLADAYGALSRGQGVINITAAIAKGGLNDQTALPYLAVSRADESVVCFRHDWFNKRVIYAATEELIRRVTKANQATRRQHVIAFDARATWNDMHGEENANVPRGALNNIHRAPVPMIPPEYRPADARAKYLIMWEVERWEMVAPVDPMLLRPLAGGLAVVVAHWDLTPIERMVMGGLLGQ